ncbi:hypothetical protein [Methanococcoides sp. AM1]|uniref:hypothetical protein n=1 Tax=Methanococcoides sp. AM1 TaxID=1201011 RepID=UPI00108297E9|nr:hypothetical protein [Methanococcoides sp. AM1]
MAAAKKVKLEVIIGTQMLGNGEIYKKGDVFDADKITAEMLISVGHAVKYVEPVEEPPEEEEPPVEE